MAIQLIQSTHPLTVGVYTALARLDVGCAWRFSEQYAEPTGMEVPVHLRALNRFWREQLSNVREVDTLEVRVNLIDQIEPLDWLRLFADHVAPAIVANNLPCSLIHGPIPTADIA